MHSRLVAKFGALFTFGLPASPLVAHLPVTLVWNRCEMPTKKLKGDKRLLGTWRSDRQRTLQDWVWRPGWRARKRKKLASIFGHLILRYTRSRLYSNLKGYKETETYELLGADSDSVVIRRWDSHVAEWRLRHIHFDGEHYYWITIGRQREWFKKIRRKPQG